MPENDPLAQQLTTVRMPIPECYANAKTIVDPKDPLLGRCSIIEKMDPIDAIFAPFRTVNDVYDLQGESEELLVWATFWIKDLVEHCINNEDKEKIGDFRPANVMRLRGTKEFGMCDFERPGGNGLIKLELHIQEWAGKHDSKNLPINMVIYNYFMDLQVGKCTIREHIVNRFNEKERPLPTHLQPSS